MPNNEPSSGTDPISRRQFLDVLSKTVITTAVFSLVAMTDRQALADINGAQCDGRKGNNPYGPYGGGCGHNPYPPYNPYKPYCGHNPYTPYQPYNPYNSYDAY